MAFVPVDFGAEHKLIEGVGMRRWKFVKEQVISDISTGHTFQGIQRDLMYRVSGGVTSRRYVPGCYSR